MKLCYIHSEISRLNILIIGFLDIIENEIKRFIQCNSIIMVIDISIGTEIVKILHFIGTECSITQQSIDITITSDVVNYFRSTGTDVIKCTEYRILILLLNLFLCGDLGITHDIIGILQDSSIIIIVNNIFRNSIIRNTDTGSYRFTICNCSIDILCIVRPESDIPCSDIDKLFYSFIIHIFMFDSTLDDSQLKSVGINGQLPGHIGELICTNSTVICIIHIIHITTAPSYI